MDLQPFLLSKHMDLSLGKVLRCPAGTPGQPDKLYEMGELYELEMRRQEIASITKQSAPELMQAFINGYGIATRALVQLEWELREAQKHMEERKAVVHLEVAPEYLQKHGLVRASNPAGTEDQRQNVLALDAEHRQLSDRYSMIKAAAAFMKSKATMFEMAYQSVKKVYDSLSTTNVLAYAPQKVQPTATFAEPEERVFVEKMEIVVGKPKY